MEKITKKKLKKIEKRKLNLQFKEWAEKVKQRDKFCVICQNKEGINSHHIFPRQIKELRFELDNGITLCQNHHRFSFKLSAHQNPVAFLIWLLDNKKEQYGRIVNLWEKINLKDE